MNAGEPDRLAGPTGPARVAGALSLPRRTGEHEPAKQHPDRSDAVISGTLVGSAFAETAPVATLRVSI
jgi:hypothetical protein